MGNTWQVGAQLKRKRIRRHGDTNGAVVKAASEIGVHPATWYAWEAGRGTIRTIYLRALSEVYGGQAIN